MGNESRLEELLAKQDIQEALTRYARGIDRNDIALAKSAYHSDGYDEHGPARGNAHEVMDRVGAALASLEIALHRITNVQIELEGDVAHVESYFHSIHVEQNSDVEEHVYGRYVDRFERRDDAWKIARRQVVMDFDSYRPRGTPSPYHDRFSLGSRGPQDPIYRQR
jgi:hypothetical protein